MANKKKKVAQTKDDNNKQASQRSNILSLESTLGAISLLSSRSQSHKYLFLSDLEWLIMPSLFLKQFALFRNKQNEPLAFVNWAKVNDDVEKRLCSGVTKLQPKDWNSGDKIYIMDVISPFTPSRELLKQLGESQFKDQDVFILMPGKDKKSLEPKKLHDFLSLKKEDDVAEKK